MGPVLFLLDIFDLSKASMIVSPIIFADDTTSLLYYIKTKTESKQWLMNSLRFPVGGRANKLPINIDKTNFSLFHNFRARRKPAADTSITICWWLGN